MRKRTKAREYALQMLYQVDLTRTDPAPTLEEFWTYHAPPAEVKAFATTLVEGTLTHQEGIDQLITAHASNWNLSRMAIVDRNILRLGVFELLHMEEIPSKVCLNEAVELAKRFGDEESGKFVNGILDAIHKGHTGEATCALCQGKGVTTPKAQRTGKTPEPGQAAGVVKSSPSGRSPTRKTPRSRGTDTVKGPQEGGSSASP